MADIHSTTQRMWASARPGAAAPRGRETARVAYLVALGVLGWCVVVAATLVPDLAGEAVFPGWGPFTLFLVVLLFGRSMAFRLFPRAVVTPDSAFYVAAAICLGTVHAAWIVGLALTLDAVSRRAREWIRGGRPTGPTAPGDFAFPFYYGGVSGALLIGVSLLYGVDRRALVDNASAQSAILWVVPAYGLTFLVVHYAVQGVRVWLEGFAAREVVRGLVLPGVVVESTLLPLAVVTVLVYRPDQPFTLMLLGTTYLLINFVFNRLSRTSAELERRVDELETLHRTGRALASSLELPEIIDRVCRETSEAVPAARSVVLSLFDDDGQSVQADVYHRDRQSFARETRRAANALDARILREGHTLRLADVRREEGAEMLADAGVGSWVGVPLRLYDRVVGMLEARSSEANVLGNDDMQMLQSIAAQASMAIQNARLYELATVDGLTGLYVRRYFDARLLEEWQRSRRFGQAFSLVMIDFDDFKAINDTAGHPAGDRVLREAARAVRQALRGIDIAARYGGEEFAVILPRARLLEAHAVAERVRADLGELCVAQEGRTLTVRASMGVACYPESGCEDPASVVEAADLALYRAKATGKNRVEIAWPPDDARAARARRPQA